MRVGQRFRGLEIKKIKEYRYNGQMGTLAIAENGKRFFADNGNGGWKEI